MKRLTYELPSMRGMRVAGLAVAGLGVVLAACGDAPEPAAEVAMALPAESQVAAAGGSVERGRLLTVHHGCGDCHGGYADPTSEAWLIGFSRPEQEFVIGPFLTRPRNLTPDNETGLGRFSERQIFNALRYGLRPGETADVEITSMTPGEGNFPVNPKYLAPPMPWPAFRHLSDQELWDIAAYLKRGLQPVSHRVEDSDGPPDFWVSEYTAEKIGQYPLPPFPTGREIAAR